MKDQLKAKYGDINLQSPALDILCVHEKILRLKQHYQSEYQNNKKDFPVSRRIIQLTARKKRMLNYLKRTKLSLFEELIKLI